MRPGDTRGRRQVRPRRDPAGLWRRAARQHVPGDPRRPGGGDRARRLRRRRPPMSTPHRSTASAGRSIGSAPPCATSRATTSCCRPRSAACCAPSPTPARTTTAASTPLPFDVVYDYGYDAIMRSFEDSLQRLGSGAHRHPAGPRHRRLTHGRAGERVDCKVAASTAAIGRWAKLQRGGRGQRDRHRRQRDGGARSTRWSVGDWDVFLLAGRYTLLEQAPLEIFLPLCQQRGISMRGRRPATTPAFSPRARSTGANFQ